MSDFDCFKCMKDRKQRAFKCSDQLSPPLSKTIHLIAHRMQEIFHAKKEQALLLKEVVLLSSGACSSASW